MPTTVSPSPPGADRKNTVVSATMSANMVRSGSNRNGTCQSGKEKNIMSEDNTQTVSEETIDEIRSNWDTSEAASMIAHEDGLYERCNELAKKSGSISELADKIETEVAPILAGIDYCIVDMDEIDWHEIASDIMKEIGEKQHASTDASVSEETIAAIVTAANEIAENSDEMRESMVAVTKALQSIIQRAGIRFGGSVHWDDGDPVEPRTFRIATAKHSGTWRIAVEYSNALAEEWDGSNWQGWADQFSRGAVASGMCDSIGVESVARQHVVKFIELLPGFLDEYCTELQRRHKQCLDLREKAEQIKAIVEK